MTESSSKRPPLPAILLAVAGFAFLVHFPWEFVQAPFFVGMAEAPHWQATLFCGRATLGDAAITLVAYGVVAIVTERRYWLLSVRRRDLAVFILAGLMLTASIELLSVYALDRWAYDDSMPLVAGIGLVPLLQWMALPPLGLWLAQRHLRGARQV